MNYRGMVAVLLLLHSAEGMSNRFLIAPFDATASMSLDIIRYDDPSAFECLEYRGIHKHTVWDKRSDNEFNKEMVVFNMHYDDQSPVEIVLSRKLGTVEDAKIVATPVAEALGKLPLFVRIDIGRVAIHPGMTGFHAGGYTNEKGQIVLYQKQIEKRLRQDHLEESLFHESIHASIDRHLTNSSAWLQVQKSDGRFITQYARQSPGKEDLAETALLVLGEINGRLPYEISKSLNAMVPARVLFIKGIFDHFTTKAADAIINPPAVDYAQSDPDSPWWYGIPLIGKYFVAEQVEKTPIAMSGGNICE